eukprot:NODE_267_length_12253_cov_0.255718.p7 type:complete len:102 gc:universal NODE_267_length_12253_cov_0.255718:350-655(+)
MFSLFSAILAIPRLSNDVGFLAPKTIGLPFALQNAGPYFRSKKKYPSLSLWNPEGGREPDVPSEESFAGTNSVIDKLERAAVILSWHLGLGFKKSNSSIYF